MFKKIYLISSLLLLVSAGCGGKSGSSTQATDTQGAPGATAPRVSGGIIQKGPFVAGSTVIVYELDLSLQRTGTNYTASTTDNLGHFTIPSGVSSRYVEAVASGQYYDEVVGTLSTSSVTLSAIIDTQESTTANINVLTTLEQKRITNLVASGNSYTQARTQAETDVLSMFNISPSGVARFSSMDISKDGNSDGVLLAVSAVLQQGNDAAALGNLISNIATDIGDGTLNDPSIATEINTNAQNVNMSIVEQNLANHYGQYGNPISLPDTGQYINDMGGNNNNNNNFQWSPVVDIPNLQITQGVRISSDVVSDNRSSVATDGTNLYSLYSDGNLKLGKSINDGSSWTSSSVDAGAQSTLTVSGGNIYAAYIAGSSTYFGVSTDGGTTFSTGLIENKSGNGDAVNSVTVDGSNVYVSYTALDFGGIVSCTDPNITPILKVAKSTDSGITWNPGNIHSVKTANTGSGCWSFKSSTYYYNGTIYVAYFYENENGVKLAKSTDGGNTWTTTTISQNSTSGAENIKLVIDSNGLYVSSGNVFYKSNDGGNTWTNGISIDNIFTAGNSMVKSSGTLLISYYDYNNHNLKIAKSTDGGLTWTNQIVVNDARGWTTGLSLNGNKVYVAYQAYSSNNPFIVVSNDLGASWATQNNTVVIQGKVVSGETINMGVKVSVAKDGNNLYACYSDLNHRLTITKSIDNGENWQKKDIVGSWGSQCEMVVSSSSVYVLNENATFMKSSNSGDTWTNLAIESGVFANGDSKNSMIVDGNNVYASYTSVGGNSCSGQSNPTDLKFAKSTDGGITWDSNNIKTMDTVTGDGCGVFQSSLYIFNNVLLLSLHS
ncbi:MAG: sialidase family protein [bacterium]